MINVSPEGNRAGVPQGNESTSPVPPKEKRVLRFLKPFHGLFKRKKPQEAAQDQEDPTEQAVLSKEQSKIRESESLQPNTPDQYPVPDALRDNEQALIDIASVAETVLGKRKITVNEFVEETGDETSTRYNYNFINNKGLLIVYDRRRSDKSSTGWENVGSHQIIYDPEKNIVTVDQDDYASGLRSVHSVIAKKDGQYSVDRDSFTTTYPMGSETSEALLRTRQRLLHAGAELTRREQPASLTSTK